MSINTRLNREWRKRNPLKARAHSIVANEIRQGRLVPEPCFNCGNKSVEAHHDDYSKPLKITWLCVPCHKKRHAPFIIVPKRKRIWKITKYELKRKAERRELYLSRMEYRSKMILSAAKLREAGQTYGAIGKMMGVSRSQVFKWVNKPKYD